MVSVLMVLSSVALADGHETWEGAAESSLSAYSLDGTLLIQGGSGEAARVKSWPCAEVRVAVREYLRGSLDDPDDEERSWRFMSYHNLTAEQALELIDATGVDASVSEIVFCTAITTDVWLPATSREIDLIVDPGRIIRVEVDGEVPTCEHGQVLMVSGTRWYGEDGWTGGRGTNWTEDFLSGPGLTVRGEFAFVCLTIFDGPVDAVDVASKVPSSQVHHNPLVRGLTGLETWLWYDFSQPNAATIGPLTASVDALGTTWNLQAFAWVDRVMWAPECESDCVFRGMEAAFDGSGFSEYVLDLPDSRDGPAASYDGGAGVEGEAPAEHLYLRKGTHVVSTATVWRGFAQLVGNGWVGAPFYYDPVVRSDAVDYEVAEVIGILTG